MASIDIQPPLGGIHKGIGFQSLPPYSAYDLLNLWSQDVRSGRKVLATRPSILSNVSPGSNVNMISRVNGSALGKPPQSLVVARAGQVYWLNGDDEWEVATGSQAAAIETDRPVFASPFLQQVFIGNSTDEPFVFDYVGGDVELLTATEGTAPTGCTMFAVFQGALCTAGDSTQRHVLFMSRTGDATDWDYGVPAEDEGGAFFTAGENEGLLNGPITALFTHSNDSLILSTLEGLVVLRGHPRRGGIMEPLATGAFVLGQGAFCKTPQDATFFLTNKGLYMLAPGAAGTPTPVSREKIPAELVGLDYDLDDPSVSLEYDSRFNVIHIAVRQTGGNTAQSWTYDIELGAFSRNEVTFAPTHLMEFPPYVTENKSGVLWAGEGYGGLGRMDRFSDDELRQTRLITNAVKLTNDQKKTAMLTKLQIVFNGDTEEGDGVLHVAVGGDAEDAVGRLRQGLAQYRVTFESLFNNKGVCYPRVTGHAVAFMIEQVEGRYGLEQISIETEPAGANRMVYAPRLTTAEGDDTDIVFTPSVWAGYVEADIPAAASTLTGYTHLMDLSRITDQTWWSNVRPSGADIRVTDESNNERAYDLITFNHEEQTGFLAFNLTISTTARNVRLWVGNQFATFPTGSAGRFNTYDDDWIGFWPNGAGNDRTINAHNFQGMNALSAGDSPGLIGNLATDYNREDEQYAVCLLSEAYSQPLTLLGYATNANTLAESLAGSSTSYAILTLVDSTGPAAGTVCMQQRAHTDAGDESWGTTAVSGVSGGNATALTLASLEITQQGNFHAATFVSNTSRNAFIQGENERSNTTSIAVGDMQILMAGEFSFTAYPPTDDAFDIGFDGTLQLLSAHAVERPDEWIARFQDMLDQATYYGDFSAWVDAP